jgi:hypothetical protein
MNFFTFRNRLIFEMVFKEKNIFRIGIKIENGS